MSVHFTFITVCKNADKTISKTFESVYKQLNNYDYDYIVIDGESSDDTLSIINNWNEKNLITYWVSEKDNGIYDAMNKAIKHVSDESYVVYLNADDELAPKALAALIKAIKTNPEADYFLGKALIVDGEKNFIQKPDIYKTTYSLMCNHQALWTKGAILKELKGFDTNCGIAADAEFMMRLFFRTKKYHIINETLSIFHRGGACSSGYDESLLLIQHKHIDEISQWCQKSKCALKHFIVGFSRRLKKSYRKKISISPNELVDLMNLFLKCDHDLNSIERFLINRILRSQKNSVLLFLSSILYRYEQIMLIKFRNN